MHEEKCIILDFLPNGYAEQRRPEPIAQAIGFNFSLLEFIIFPEKKVKTEDEIELEKNRDAIRFIRRLDYKKLTNFAMEFLPSAIELIIKKREKDFVDFFNNAKTITPRMHQFQLLPSVGKKHVMELLSQRQKKPFESLDDIATRVKLMNDPIKIISQRIRDELKGDQKYYLFVKQNYYKKPY